LIIVGPPERLQPEEALQGEMHRERGTGSDGNAMESLHFRLAWPRVRQGGRAVHLRGTTDLRPFLVEVRRHGSALDRRRATVPGGAGSPRRFALELVIPDGIRGGDTIILFTDPPGTEVEPSFRPIRN
jgi:hypothetical protein